MPRNKKNPKKEEEDEDEVDLSHIEASDTVEGMQEWLEDPAHGHPLKWFRKGRTITVNDKMQEGYQYTLQENPGKNLAEDFKPYYTPKQMLELGVFEGKMFNDGLAEFPREWFEGALAKGKLSPEGADPSLNLLGLKSRQSLQTWRRNGWIIGDDVRGWAQWFFRYWLGRRDPAVDKKQISRWKAFRRHAGQILASYQRMAPSQRPSSRAQKKKHHTKQRQALLQWSYDPWL